MGFERYVQDETVQEFKIDDDVWTYKPTSGGDEIEWLNDCLVEKNGKLVQDSGKVNQMKMVHNIISVPFDKVFINEQINIDKDWSELSSVERWRLLRSFKGTILNTILSNINKIETRSVQEANQKKT